MKDQPIKAVYTWDNDSRETPYFKRELRYVSQISSTWTYTVVNVSGAAGIQNDLVVEPSSPYTMQIAYIYRDTLNYAYRNGTDWVREVVDHITTPSSGQHLSLAISPKTPFTQSIAYYDETDNELKYAYKDGSTWKKQVVSSGGLAPSLALSSVEPFTPHISYIDKFVMHAWWTGTGWITETIDNNGVPDTLFTDIQLSAGHPNLPFIVYADKKQDSLNFASYDNENWTITPVAELDPNCTGRHLDAMSAFALETEPPYFPHITFVENPRRIEHIWQTNSGWHSETVDIYPYISAIEGIDIAIALSPASPPDIYLGYSHRTDLYYAYKRNGKWLVSKNKIKTTGWGDTQRHVSLALAPTENSLYFTYVDPNMGDLIMLTSKDAENISFMPVIFASNK